MKYLIWAHARLYICDLAEFAVKNDQPVVLRYFLGYEWHASLVLVLLLFFCGGYCCRYAGSMGNLLRPGRKEISALKNELRLKNKNEQG